MAGPELLVRSRKEKRKQKRGKTKKQPPSTAVTNSSPRVPRNNQSKSKTDRRPPHSSQKRSSSSSAALIHPSNKRQRSSSKNLDNESPYAHLDSDTAAALRRDDEEIKELEEKLGLADAKEKKRLHKEYITQEGYGEDFGDFLDDLDHLVHRIKSGSSMDRNENEADEVDEEEDYWSHSESSSPSDTEEKEQEREENHDNNDSNDDEEAIPMAPPALKGLDENGSNKKEEASSSDASSGDSSQDEEEENDDKDDHAKIDTYRPTKGQDIYGNTVESKLASAKPSKYVPPHLRDKSGSNRQKTNDIALEEEKTATAVVSAEDEESFKTIRRTLNNALNRLSEDTLVTVSQSITRLYPSHPTANVNQCIWENMQNACVFRSYLMTGLTPLYVAAIVGVHLQKGDAAQLGEHIIESTITDAYKGLALEREKEKREGEKMDQEGDSAEAKQVSNLVLILCYLYNFDVVHCSLMYDVIRDLIKNFKEIDIELLLIILSHCGKSLRSDDPSALKAIVLTVQKRALHTSLNSSRVDYMIAAVMDLKNNKRRQQDAALSDKTGKLRKLIGRVKAAVAASNGNVRSSDSSLRIALKDILDAEGKGRWWRVGASWEGNQHSYKDENDPVKKTASPDEEDEAKEDALLRLAAKYRMNSDTRRSIFCIIMGSADFEDAFEKLVRAGMLKNKAERDTARVLMECCGNEKTYNKYYAHLAKRICEYQSQAKFTLQLAYWDAFKQLEEMKPRKAANLAKLLFSLVVEHRILKIGVLKGIDMTTPEDLPEIGMIFLTVFFTNIMEHFQDPQDVSSLFESGLSQRRFEAPEEGDDLIGQGDETEALYASLTLFFVQVLKSSPKNSKGSKFRSNLKAAIKCCDSDNFFM